MINREHVSGSTQQGLEITHEQIVARHYMHYMITVKLNPTRTPQHTHTHTYISHIMNAIQCMHCIMFSLTNNYSWKMCQYNG